jgi:hypothetical protein
VIFSDKWRVFFNANWHFMETSTPMPITARVCYSARGRSRSLLPLFKDPHTLSVLRIVLHHSKHNTLSMDDRSTFLCPQCETVVTVSTTPDGAWNACCPNIACHAEFSKEKIDQIFAGTPMKSATEERA